MMMFQSLKLEQKREYASKLEDINSRAEVMMRIFSQGKAGRIIWMRLPVSMPCREKT